MGHDLDQALDLLKKKQKDYTAYRFKTKETMAIFAFFDLAQEFASLNNLYRIAVAVIGFFFNYQSCIYTIRPEDEALMLQCCTSVFWIHLYRPGQILPHTIALIEQGLLLYFPLLGKRS